MKKKILRVIALVIALTLLLTTVAFAATEASAYIAVTSAWISRDGNTVEVNFYIIGTGTMDLIGVKKIYLYENNGYTWSLVHTFDYTNPTYTSILMDSSTSAHAGYVTYSGSANKSYAATCYFYAEKAGGSDTYVQNTPVG